MIFKIRIEIVIFLRSNRNRNRTILHNYTYHFLHGPTIMTPSC